LDQARPPHSTHDVRRRAGRRRALSRHVAGGHGTIGTVDVQEVVNKVEPGLVVINTRLNDSDEAAAGTGMVINPDGLVLTNNHVIENLHPRSPPP